MKNMIGREKAHEHVKDYPNNVYFSEQYWTAFREVGAKNFQIFGAYFIDLGSDKTETINPNSIFSGHPPLR